MATWTTIGDTFLEPGKPVRSVDGLALRDNPIAISEGAAGAPKILTAAINVNASLEATARDAVGGGVGTYSLLARTSVSENVTLGETFAGSLCTYVGARFDTDVWVDSTTSPAGTWRAMTIASGGGTGTQWPIFIALRIA